MDAEATGEKQSRTQHQQLYPAHLRLAKPQCSSVDGENPLTSGTTASSKHYFPVQIDYDNDKTRNLYFDSEERQKFCLGVLLRVQGFANQIDQYQVFGELGEGGSSKVMLARHKATDESFAIKII